MESLVQDILGGQVRIPTWQRTLKWLVDDVMKLLDSIYRGYPIGTLLLWKRRAPAEEIAFGTVTITAMERSDALFVIDGQQRLTSLVRVLAGAGAPDEKFALFFNMKDETFVAPPKGEVGPTLIPLTEVLDSRRLVKWLLQHPTADQDRAIELGKRVREYTVPLYTVETDDERAVRDIFERTNNTGRALDAADVFDGRFAGAGKRKPSGIRDVADAVGAMAFGKLDEDELHKMMLALVSTDPTKSSTEGWTSEVAHRVLADLLAATERVVSFLVGEAGIPHRTYLPYAQPLLTLARFFHAFPAPHARNRALLVRWLWRGASAGLHGGVSVDTRAALAAIQADDDGRRAERREDESVQALLAQVEPGRQAPFDPQVDHFNGGHARGKICILALAELGPRHLVTGEALRHEASSPRRLADGVPGQASLGNRLLHPPVKGGLRAAVARCTDPAILASHAIEPGDQHLVAADVTAFIDRRAARLDKAVRALVARRAAWDERDHPPLRAFWDEDDGGG
ncbi:MAG: DUF262 domain-containing protein [Deltaproteobacteria bacterium]|nr:DUF262 domain-containing protein [Deltaproteobacteria bacterium]